MKIPFIRGMISLWDSLNLGTRLLTKSANIATGEDEPLEGTALFFTVLLSLALSIGLFFVLPAFLAGLIERYLEISSWWSNLIEGLIRLFILIGYLFIMGRIRTFVGFLLFTAQNTKPSTLSRQMQNLLLKLSANTHSYIPAAARPSCSRWCLSPSWFSPFSVLYRCIFELSPGF